MLPEIESYLQTLDKHRAKVGGLISKASLDGLNWRPSLPAGADPTNSLAVLAVHVAGAEHFWIAECIGKYAHTRNRAAEFTFVASSTEEPLARLAKVAMETQDVLSKLTLIELDGSFMKDDHAVSVRWAILHVISHYSLHIGHMELTYQLGNGGKAFDG